MKWRNEQYLLVFCIDYEEWIFYGTNDLVQIFVGKSQINLKKNNETNRINKLKPNSLVFVFEFEKQKL